MALSTNTPLLLRAPLMSMSALLRGKSKGGDQGRMGIRDAHPSRRRLEQPIRTFAHRRAHWELARNEITQGITRMCAHAIRTIEITHRVPIGIVFPGDLF